ncbi:MAG: flagellar biosynthesis anti-sigma factor FlgM [Pseudohaliea sp.]
MADSISGLGKGPEKAAGTPAARSNSAPAGNQAARPAAGTDSVNLTDTARQLQALSRAVDGTDPVDSSRVEAVRLALEAGQYSVDSRRIAEQLLQFDN